MDATMTKSEFDQLADTVSDVVVVGLGPVGITLCNLLGTFGVRVVGIDARDDVYSLPRAIGMDHEVMRVFQNIGIADDLADAVGEYRDSLYQAADGTVLRKFISPPPPHKLGWPAYLTFVQPRLETLLRGKASASEHITLHTGVEVTGLERPDKPLLTLRKVATGKTVRLNSRFVVGCDGGSSFVRRELGIKFDDLIFDQPWLVIDVILGDGTHDLPETNVQFCNPARPHTYVVLPGRLRRWEFMLLPGEMPEEINRPERLWELLSMWIQPGQAEIWRSATYRFHALVAEKWRQGSVFLAGDACHMTPPFLAQGMVQGIKDAANLAWKLAFVLSNGTHDNILDTYERERRPVVHKVIAITKALGDVICELDEDRAKIRDDELKLLALEGKSTLVRQELFPPITDGLIARSDNDEPMKGAGEPCPQPRVLVDGRPLLLDDVSGQGFALLTYEWKIGKPLLRRAAELGVSLCEFSSKVGDLKEEEAVLQRWLASLGARAALVRPDHVTFGVAADASGLKELFDQLERGIARR
jgi:3-(3-hydroxy-phenyl)propionate hydroxylase